MLATTLYTLRQNVDDVARHLPFGLDDIAQANQTYVRWVETGDAEDERLVEIWTYCFIRRYVIQKFLAESKYPITDVDTVMGKIYERTREKRAMVNQPDRYASWVSVICKNTFLNYVRAFRPRESVEDAYQRDYLPSDDRADAGVEAYDLSIVLQALEEAIAALPSFLQETAHRRFLQEQTYEEISAHVDKPVATIRSYVNKILNHFRNNAALMELAGEWRAA